MFSMKFLGCFVVAAIVLSSCQTQDTLQECKGDDQYVDPCGVCAPRCLDGEFVQNYYKTCTEGCVCPKGFILDEKNGNCIPIEKCKGVPKCPRNKEYVACGPPCTSLCINGSLALAKCRPCCNPGCFCKDGYIATPEGDCVKRCELPPKNEGN